MGSLRITAAAMAAGLAILAAGPAAAQQTFEVRLDGKIEKPMTGRLFVIASAVPDLAPPPNGAASGQPPLAPIETLRQVRELVGLSASPGARSNTALAAMAQVRLVPGGSVEVDGDAFAAPP